MPRMNQQHVIWNQVSRAKAAKSKPEKPSQPLRTFNGRAAALRLQREAAKR
jgi:hypothetical protein